MESNRGDASEILPEIEALKAKRNDIDSKISALGAQLREIKLQNGNNDDVVLNNDSCPAPISRIDSGFGHGLTAEMIYRYSRHLLLPSFGVQGQSNLLKSFVLVVGAGGLGSPALLYLAACGVGRLGIVDHDVIELNNMHRQIIHAEEYIGQPKVKSAAAACFSINSTIKIVEHKETLRTSNVLEILSQYDIIVDATDNAPSRYMISDCCVVLGKPLVSGAAVGLEGQFTITMVVHATNAYFQPHHLQQQCQRCSDSGVLGVVPGVIDCLQALEAIKIASAVGEPLSGRILLFDALSARIRIVKIRGRSSQCKVCGENAAFSKQEFPEFDYEKFTQTPLSPSPLKLNLLQADSRISSKEFRERIVNGESHVLVDVRPEHHFKIVSLPKSLNIPLPSLEARLAEISSALKKEDSETNSGSGPQLYVVCRRGNDSQRAVRYLHNMGFTSAKDIIGGLEGWARTCLRISRCVNHGS